MTPPRPALAERLGRIRFWQNTGEPYTQTLREIAKPALGVTVVSSYLGMGPTSAALMGVATAFGLIAFSIFAGMAAIRWGVFHGQVSAERDANPITSRAMELLEQVASNTARSTSAMKPLPQLEPGQEIVINGRK